MIPVLEPGCGSWVVSADNGRKVFETFSSVTAERAANSGWKVETAAQYLARINAAITSRPTPTATK